MTGTRHGKELGQALDQAEDRRRQMTHLRRSFRRASPPCRSPFDLSEDAKETRCSTVRAAEAAPDREGENEVDPDEDDHEIDRI